MEQSDDEFLDSLDSKSLKAFEKVWDLQSQRELFVFGSATYVAPPSTNLPDYAEQRARAVMQVIDGTLMFMTRDREFIVAGQGAQGDQKSWFGAIKDKVKAIPETIKESCKLQPQDNPITSKFLTR